LGQAGLLNTFLLFRTRLIRRVLERIFMSPRKPLALLCLCFALAFAANSNAQTKLLRFPDFTATKLSSLTRRSLARRHSGGLATRLTAHPGVEVFAKFSPDGNGSHSPGSTTATSRSTSSGTADVPKQLTFYPAAAAHPALGLRQSGLWVDSDGKSIVFRSLREHFDLGDNRLYTVSPDGGLPQALAHALLRRRRFRSDGSEVVYSPLFRDFRTWKRYSGGWAQQLYIFDLKTHAAEKITRRPARSPRSHVGRRQNFLFIGQGRHAQSLRL